MKAEKIAAFFGEEAAFRGKDVFVKFGGKESDEPARRIVALAARCDGGRVVLVISTEATA